MSLTLPNAEGTTGKPEGSSPSPRRAISPLLEVRRPHCTLNCDNCNFILENRFKHSSKPTIIIIPYHIPITYYTQLKYLYIKYQVLFQYCIKHHIHSAFLYMTEYCKHRRSSSLFKRKEPRAISCSCSVNC